MIYIIHFFKDFLIFHLPLIQFSIGYKIAYDTELNNKMN